MRRSSKVKVAEFLATVGEGNVFTKLQLFEGVPNVAQADRRMRDLRDLGWEIDNYKTNPSLHADEYLLAKIGTRIDLGEQPEQPARNRISARRRLEAFSAAGHACQICGVSVGELHPDSDSHRPAMLGAFFIDSTPPASTELSNIRVECDRCHAADVRNPAAAPTPEEVLARAAALNSREDKRRLYRLMQAGRLQRDDVELAFMAWSRLGSEEKVHVMLKFAGELIDGPQ
ncbi:hypothetical protein ACFYN3_12525 [Streptomyces lavendulae]|uniref:hypothetical protein n=1 Tax=Streptomyces lavendulae TaxID=1914 RepID=UPI0036CF601A